MRLCDVTVYHLMFEGAWVGDVSVAAALFHLARLVSVFFPNAQNPFTEKAQSHMQQTSSSVAMPRVFSAVRGLHNLDHAA